ncbi:PREDICTED: uncharacterized protein LOC108519770, partial [Rhinopithecus bieti]|uniref:uncharacterized protein LOC108519770 n=1 Tax=Rhinopithecus bieti TaxID=61621 RepID=UPI00083BF217
DAAPAAAAAAAASSPPASHGRPGPVASGLVLGQPTPAAARVQVSVREGARGRGGRRGGGRRGRRRRPGGAGGAGEEARRWAVRGPGAHRPYRRRPPDGLRK